MAILGEIPILEGKVTLGGQAAYVSEESWIFSDTVRENVLFGCEMSNGWYQKVIKACSLDQVCMCCGDVTHVCMGIVITAIL